MNRNIVVTGGAHGIGLAIVRAFEKAGDHVAVIDKNPNPYFVGDLAEQATLDEFVSRVLADFGSIDVLVNNACLSKGGLSSCSYEDFNYVLRVGVSVPFYLSQRFQDHFRPGGSIINISSIRERASQPDTESYTAAKGAIGALTRALAITLAGKVRVNAIAPGWIDTFPYEITPTDRAQQPTKSIGQPEDVAALVLFLASDEARYIDGASIDIDGGMSKQMIYHGEYGWTFDPESVKKP